MRTTDEQLEQVLARSEHLRSRTAARRSAVPYALACAACLALIAFVVSTMPQVGGEVAPPAGAAFGSLALGGPTMGFVLVCLLAFALGVCVTLLVVHLRGK